MSGIVRNCPKAALGLSGCGRGVLGGFGLFSDLDDFDDGGAVDTAAGSFAPDQGLGFSEIALDKIGGDAGDVGERHVAVAAAVVVGPDGLEGRVDDEFNDEVERLGVLG